MISNVEIKGYDDMSCTFINEVYEFLVEDIALLIEGKEYFVETYLVRNNEPVALTSDQFAFATQMLNYLFPLIRQDYIVSDEYENGERRVHTIIFYL